MFLWTVDFTDKCYLWINIFNFITFILFKSDLLPLTSKSLFYL